MNKTLQRALTGAALMISATAANAQNLPLIAKIPFAFRAVGSDLPAGEYTIRAMSFGSAVLEIRNAATRETVYVFGDGQRIDTAWQSNGASPYLTFQCMGDACDLDSLASASRSPVRFGIPGRSRTGRKNTATIHLTPYLKK